MKKIKRPTGKELLGSVGIATAIWTGALALNHGEEASKASAAATQFTHEADQAAEGGLTEQSNATKEWADSAHDEVRFDKQQASYFGTLALVGLGLGLGSFGSQAKEDSGTRTSAVVQPVPESHADDYPTVPLTMAEPTTYDAPHMSDATQRMERVVIPVPRPEPPVLQKR